MIPTFRIYKPRKDGYVRCKLADGRIVYYHRLIMEELLNRKLIPKEIVHHKNTVRDDNRPVNLKLCPSQKLHFKYHRRAKQVWLPCDNCGKPFPLTQGQLINRHRQGSTKFFCSRPCFENNLKGKPFSGKPHRWALGYKFANRKSRKGTHLVKWITLTCQFCKVTFDVPPAEVSRKFCSTTCSQKGRDFSSLKGKVNPPESFIRGWETRRKQGALKC